MRRFQSPGQHLPLLWLISDRRNDAGLENALRRLPRGSGFVFRHYHLDRPARRARFESLARIARAWGHVVILADQPETARRWRADGVYGAADRLRRAHGLLRLATAHDLREVAAANRAGADAVFLSPVFGTRSHPGARSLGPVRFRLLARRASAPVIALGGLNVDTARSVRWLRWAAIDGLSIPGYS